MYTRLPQRYLLLPVLLLGIFSNMNSVLGSDCGDSSCHPAAGNLLIGRANRIFASSTCGLRNPNSYCVVSHVQDKMNRCFICDSQTPFGPTNPNSHRVESIVSSFAENWRTKWWQTENGVSDVYLQVDFEAEFLLTHLIMKFRTFRPAAMLIERSGDFGKTWKVYRYFAEDCKISFPGISTGPVRNLDDVICDSKYSDIEPSTEGEVIFRVLPVTVFISDPYSESVQNLLKITNLRMNFSALHTLGDDLLQRSEGGSLNYYYALYSLILRGSCSCYGHASLCTPISGQEYHVDMVHGKCECRHNTKGLHCELCDDLYNDLPWRPAIKRNSNACKRCECHDHATSCHFDAAIYEASGQISGGVCDGCQHNTDGRNCHLCLPFFYQDPLLDLNNLHICKPCDCDPHGSEFSGECNVQTDPTLGLVAGRCVCKRHAIGSRCEFCETGYWNLESSNKDGCKSCKCDVFGTVNGSIHCDQATGQCSCKRYVTGKQCDKCLDGYWSSIKTLDRCLPCDCDLGGAFDESCSDFDGQCICRKNVKGIKCNKPKDGFFFPNFDHLAYEAELAQGSKRTAVVMRNPSESEQVTWTGPGFMKASSLDTIEFSVDNIPLSLNYSIVIRYETQVPMHISLTFAHSSIFKPRGPCIKVRPKQHLDNLILSPDKLHYVISKKICLEEEAVYSLRMHLHRQETSYQNASILIDSIVLIPDIANIPAFQTSKRGRAAAVDFHQRRCLKFQLPSVHTKMPDQCLQYLQSISAAVYNGSVACHCHPVGSVSQRCQSIGGQCSCKPNVIGRQCDECAPGSNSLSFNGCQACDCNWLGSHDSMCDRFTGQCKCIVNIVGLKCNRCHVGMYKFPKCQPCQCRGHADECDDLTGRCIGCRNNTAGHNCERCSNGYWGNPKIGCQPCLCPGGVGSGVQHADTCHYASNTKEVKCNCQPGYTGLRCDRCEMNHFGQPLVVGGICQRCSCNDNIDHDVADSCDIVTGRCLKCLFNSDGFLCERCATGYYGDAVRQHKCLKCMCDILGSNRSNIECDRMTGQCPCLPNVIGRKCDQCRPLYWKLARGVGCEPCACDPVGSLSLQCNEFDGQCSCLNDRRGRDCSQCKEFYWGNAHRGCIPCDCDMSGSLDMQCNQKTGQCNCSPLVTGRKCDQCVPSSTGTQPGCQPCGECFDNWTAILKNSTNEADALMLSGRKLVLRGVPRSINRGLRRIEKKLNRTRAILETKSVSRINIAETRKILFMMRDNLTQAAVMTSATESQLRGISNRHYKVKHRIKKFSKRRSSLQEKLNSLQDEAHLVEKSDVTGTFKSLTEIAFRSAPAQNTIHATADAIIDSELVRIQVDDITNEFQTQYNLQMNDNRISAGRVKDSLTKIDRGLIAFNCSICMRRGSSCDFVYGNDECNKCSKEVQCQDGLMSLVADADGFTIRTDVLLSNKSKAVDDVAVEVSHLELACKSAYQKAVEALLAAENTRNLSERQRNDLDVLVNVTSSFNSETKAKPDDIAAETLQLKVHLTPDRIYRMARQIRKALHGIKNVDEILNSTRDDLQKARNLKDNANYCKKESETAFKRTQVLMRNLNHTSAEQNKTVSVISEVRETAEVLENNFRLVESQAAFNKEQLENLKEHLKKLHLRMETVKNKEAFIEMKIQQATTLTETLKHIVFKLNENLTELEDMYRKVREGLDQEHEKSTEAKSRIAVILSRANALQQRLVRAAELEEEFFRTEQALMKLTSMINAGHLQMSNILTDLTNLSEFHRKCGRN